MHPYLTNKMRELFLKELPKTINKAGRVFGNPLEVDDIVEMRAKYFRIVGKLDQNGCNFILIMAKLVEASLEELDEIHKERDARGVN